MHTFYDDYEFSCNMQFFSEGLITNLLCSLWKNEQRLVKFKFIFKVETRTGSGFLSI